MTRGLGGAKEKAMFFFHPPQFVWFFLGWQTGKNRTTSYNRGFGGQRCKLCTYWAVATGIQDVPGLQVHPFCFGHECQKLIEAPAIENLPSLNALAFKIQVLSCSLRILEFLPHFRYSICALVWLSDEKARAAGIAAALAAQKIGVAALTRCDGDLLLLTLWFLICFIS